MPQRPIFNQFRLNHRADGRVDSADYFIVVVVVVFVFVFDADADADADVDVSTVFSLY